MLTEMAGELRQALEHPAEREEVCRITREPEALEGLAHRAHCGLQRGHHSVSR